MPASANPPRAARARSARASTRARPGNVSTIQYRRKAPSWRLPCIRTIRMPCSTQRGRDRCSGPKTAARPGASIPCRAPARAFTRSPARSNRDGLGGRGCAAGRGRAMAFENWRGTVGIIKPTLRPGSIEELIRLLPEGIGVVVTNINITTGTQQEFSQVIPHYEARIAELAEAEVELI